MGEGHGGGGGWCWWSELAINYGNWFNAKKKKCQNGEKRGENGSRCEQSKYSGKIGRTKKKIKKKTTKNFVYSS